ncbi:glycoside hydrolase family 55 protein [Aquiflexum sp. TKW24L]|uniref:right-handed parallel beta-helix repeat-containing protein n=1 Tax=Aquiflexum sp. TKW24L TaxID=2942212 RepID=UPI0020C0483C|nr:right-handed parallel beta-helix repeat-containing protein [Aquiflexum sp. TKW24L]MCL6260683.1 glycoside hydrolase family 55 protein [Aquiflexum sp. TKW24L]
MGTKIRHVIFFMLLSVLVFPAKSWGLQSGKIINVKDFQALGDGMTNDTQAIQEAIRSGSPGDTVLIPEGIFLVKTIGLKSGVHLKSLGILRQQVDILEEFSQSKQNSSAPIIRGKDVSDIHLILRLESQNEGIYLTGSSNISIDKSEFKGDGTSLRSFAGILLYKCQMVSIQETKVSHYGIPRLQTHTYQPGTGIRILESENIIIDNSNIQYNGENGVFIHYSKDISVLNSVFRFNGMSAIQVAFGNSGIEKNYSFINNLMEDNAADAIDINNRSEKPYWDINCLIEENTSKRNGFVSGKSTPDGSGIATLINVSGVRMINNTAEKNNRPALYIENCGEIYAESNKADNQVELVLGLGHLNLVSNEFGNLNLLANVRAKKISLQKNRLNNISMPNGVEVDSLLVMDNEITNGMMNFNLVGNVSFIGNKISSESENPVFLVVKASSISIGRNEISSLRSNAILVQKTAQHVSITNNAIQSINSCIVDNGAENLQISGNKLMSLAGGKTRFTLESNNPNNLFLSGNEHVGVGKIQAVIFRGKGTASVEGEKFTQGVPQYGEIRIINKGM